MLEELTLDIKLRVDSIYCIHFISKCNLDIDIYILGKWLINYMFHLPNIEISRSRLHFEIKWMQNLDSTRDCMFRMS